MDRRETFGVFLKYFALFQIVYIVYIQDMQFLRSDFVLKNFDCSFGIKNRKTNSKKEPPTVGVSEKMSTFSS